MNRRIDVIVFGINAKMPLDRMRPPDTTRAYTYVREQAEKREPRSGKATGVYASSKQRRAPRGQQGRESVIQFLAGPSERMIRGGGE
jgi:hypothetical protein